jgi:hypothetical protein
VGRQMRLRDLDTSLDQLEGLRPRFTSTKPSRFVATKVSRPAAITPTSTYGLLRFIQDRHFMQPTCAVYRQSQGSRPGVRYGCWPTA